MSDYYWDNQIEYLSQTRWLYYNDDYLAFLVEKVWKINRPINIVDYGCGYGYLGLKLLPMLPEGSTYTGIDKGEELIRRAEQLFNGSPYQTTFIVGDIEDVGVQRKYDVAWCHAFLLHMTDPQEIVRKMIASVKDSGKVIAFEPHWIGNMSNYRLEGAEQSDVIRLGLLQQLFEADARRTGKDGNIGMKLPILMSQLGLADVECRISDRVNFLNPKMETAARDKLYQSLRDEGIGQQPGDLQALIASLTARGLKEEEAKEQYEAELSFSQLFHEESWLTYAPNMKISFGTVRHV
ncbi:class I SAM-dependent methyltransferase [Paenibacillus sp. YIM B09110]|uniref:class I SAM-dependent methyltransferase n=1 Tax=Paenibacillus sp. YIM B09110 TaxID=3126102 RepID=UPI00301BC185